MPTGILGTANLGASTNTTIYTVPAGKVSVANINICNRGIIGAKVRVALTLLATPTLDEYIEYDVTIPANSVLERTGIVLDTGKKIVVFSDLATISVVAVGYEE